MRKAATGGLLLLLAFYSIEAKVAAATANDGGTLDLRVHKRWSSSSSSIGGCSSPRLQSLLARRGGIKIRAEPVLEESSRGHKGDDKNNTGAKGGNAKDDIAARVSYGSDGQRGLRMDVDLDVNELTNSLGPAAKPLVAVAKAVYSTIFYTAPMLALAGLITQIAGITCSRYTKTQADKGNTHKQQQQQQQQQQQRQRVKEQHEKEKEKEKEKAAVLAASIKDKKNKSASPSSSSSSSSSLLSYFWKPSTSGGKKPAFVTTVRGGASSSNSPVLDWQAFGDLVGRGAGQWTGLVVAGTILGQLLNKLATQDKVKIDPHLLLALDVFVAFSAIFLSEKVGLLKSSMDMNWYNKVLRKPTWTPRPIVFPLVWVPLKLLQTGALTIIFRLVERQAWRVPTLVFLLHLTLGDLWNRVFFGEKRIGFGLSVMFAFYGSLAAACYSFYSVKPLAAYLLIPTAVWVFIATSLNYSIWLMNGQETRFPIKKA